MQEINYSIIIPHHNIPNLLQRCLDSIPERNDVQIIVVDDNSNPDIVDFDNFPGKNKPYTEVYLTKEGKGAGYARNIGLQYAKGKWLIFIDADDFLMPNFSSLLDKYFDAKEEILFFHIDSVYCDSLRQANRHIEKENCLQNYSKDQKQLDFFLRYGYTEPWGKFIKRDLVQAHEIQFEESFVANDYRFSVQTGFYAKKVLLVNDTFYCLTIREGSLCNNMFESENKALCRFRVYEGIQSFFKENGIKLYPLNILVFGAIKQKRIFNSFLKEAKRIGYKPAFFVLKSCSIFILHFLKPKSRYIELF